MYIELGANKVRFEQVKSKHCRGSDVSIISLTAGREAGKEAPATYILLSN